MVSCLISQGELEPPGFPQICGACSHISWGTLPSEAWERMLRAKGRDLMTPEAWATLSSFVERQRPRWEAFAGPGTPFRDILDLNHIAHGHHDWLTAEEQDAALQCLVAQAPVFLPRQARRALAQRARDAHLQPREQLQRHILPAAVLLVVAESETPQRLQVGRTRIRTAEGAWQPLPPVSLLPWQYVQWFFAQISKAAVALLLDYPYPHPHTPRAPIIEQGVCEAAPSPERTVQARSILRAMWDIASPQQRDILRLHFLEGEPVGEIAARLGISRSHVYAQLARLQAKIEAL
jgi:RNA polymerase sigma factor (sigma-70 family)